MLDFMIRLYDSNKKQVKQSQFYRARYFHIFLKQKSGLKKLTSEIEEIPTFLKSASDKRYFVETAVEYVRSAIEFKRLKDRERKKAQREAPKNKVKEEAQKVQEKIEKTKKKVDSIVFPEPEITNYDFPPKPIVNRLSQEVVEYVYRMVEKKVSGAEIPWTRKRIESFVKSISKYFAGKNIAIPTDRKFIDTLIVVNLGYKGEDGFDGIVEASKEDKDFFDYLNEKEATKNYLTGSSVKFQTKEIFRHNYIDGMVEYNTKRGEVLKYREQTVLLQMELKYEELMRVDQNDLLNDAFGFEGPLSRVKGDIKFLLQQALDKGIFNYTERQVYSVRLITPLFARGMKLGDRLDEKGELSNGYGYSCPRSSLQNYNDIDKIIESLFNSFKTDMLTYLARSNMASFAFEGLTIERLVNP